MKLNEYQILAGRTDHGNEISQDEALKCWALGLTGEAGEVADIIKKHFYHGRPMDKDKLKKELGDVLWYLSMCARDLGFTLEEVAEANIEKLRKRYPNGFSHEDSRARKDESTTEVPDNYIVQDNMRGGTFP